MDKTGGFFLVIILAMVLIWVAVNPNLTDMLANKTAEDEDTTGADGGGGNVTGTDSSSGGGTAQVTKLSPAATTPEEVVKNTMGSISKNNVFAPMGVIGGKVLVKK